MENTKNTVQFEEELSSLPTVSLLSIQPERRTLYIIGNGFDLMHGVKSSYAAFRDSLGRNHPLRFYLESYLKSDHIWADFEEALGHFNMDVMANPDNVGEMLDLYGAFDEDAGAADYYIASEMAASPIRSVADELPKRFRAWVETLKIGTDERPLESIFHDDKVLCFNYTEFVEELYGVSEDHVCYIHGCRRRKKGQQKERLILGHIPDANAAEYEEIQGIRKKNSYRSQLIDLAQDEVIRLISQGDEDLTKDCGTIIKAHERFFRSLTDVKNVIVIGHSLSMVDWDYFIQVAENALDAHWYFGCHDIRDLENEKRLVNVLGVGERTSVFRTDTISVRLLPEPKRNSRDKRPPKAKTAVSWDGIWRADWIGRKLTITDGRQTITRIFPESVRHCAFGPAGDILFVLADGLNAGVHFFRFVDNAWVYIDEMESIPNQNLINRRLQHVYLTDETITFVYNSRVRVYALGDGALLKNQAKRNAKDGQYEGTEISGLFRRLS